MKKHETQSLTNQTLNDEIKKKNTQKDQKLKRSIKRTRIKIKIEKICLWDGAWWETILIPESCLGDTCNTIK